MSKKILKFFIFSFLLLFVGFFKVNAFTENANEEYIVQMLASTSSPKINSVRVNGDIATISSSGSVAGYYIGTSNSVSSRSTYSVSTSANTYYAGVKNGYYYFWVYGTGVYSGSASAVRYVEKVHVTTSCSNETVTNAKGSGTVERCFLVEGNTAKPDQTGELVSCASGYTLAKTTVSSNGCSNVSMTYNGQALKKRYCKVVYAYSCVANSGSGGTSTPVAAASLTGLSVSNGTLSPQFNASTKSYKVNVSGDVSSIKINATAASGSSFVSGYGSRTVNLSYGANNIEVRVRNSAGAVTTYKVVVTRADNRSGVNTLSSLTINNGQLTPNFSSNNTTYSVAVGSNVTSVNIGATLTDTNSYFVTGFGPRTVTLNPGLNNVLIKIKSQSGKLKVYTINITRAMTNQPGDTCTTQAEELALLKEIEITTDLENVELENIEFDPKTFTYNMKVPYEVANLSIKGYVQTDGDNAVVTGGNNLEVNVEQVVTIVVTSKSCPSISKTYTIGVTRQSEVIPSSEAEINNIKIQGHDEFEFQPNEDSRITIGKKEKELVIEIEKKDETTTCEIIGNEKLAYGSEILIKCTSEDGTNTREYKIVVAGVEKGTNVFLVVIIVIIVILIIVYLVLRLLGYRIYFNFAVIGAFFRGIVEKIKNVFDK